MTADNPSIPTPEHRAWLEAEIEKLKHIEEGPEAESITMADRCVIGVCVTDHMGFFLHVNQPYCQIYGYEPEELLGKHFTTVAPDEERIEVWQMIHDAFMETGQEIAGEWVVRRKDGKLLTINTDATRVTAPDGHYRKFTFVHDLTDLRNLQKNFEEVRNRMAALIDQPFLPVLLADANTLDVKLANKAFLEYSGLDAGKIQDQTLDGLLKVDTGWQPALEALRQADTQPFIDIQVTTRFNGEATLPARVQFLDHPTHDEVMVLLGK